MGYQDVETNFKLAYLQNKNKYLIGIVPRKGKWSFVNKYLTRVSTGKSFIFLPAWRLKLGEFGSKRQSQTGRSYFLHGSVCKGEYALQGQAHGRSGGRRQLLGILTNFLLFGLHLGHEAWAKFRPRNRPSQEQVLILTTRGAAVLACCLVPHWPTPLCWKS